ncbi:SulP family inorganic anion transporter [Dechloromonas denitrificans]|uniref:SulP family inorganic anion transporter n=1 Tax=Dechloromonas denitrificans TaxID=281362 RepID=UPI001CFA86A8|nr:SulP family inorganic anion transporter [Dechloromonas denitrificans]UCV05986.1 SulP family inorganic anion transporter [Dechloromonas denitrificans]
MSAFPSLLPAWLRHYPREKLGTDIVAGLIVTILVIPQSLAYALLAGLPPQLGLYVSILPVIAYAWLGSSMVQAVGPVAVTAIMTYAVLSPIAAPGSPEYIALAAALSLISGLMLLACGVLRLGFLSQLLSRPVISGFISGSAVLIIISQLKYLLGVTPHGSSSGEVVLDVLGKLLHSHLPTLSIGLAALGLLFVVRYALAGWLIKAGLSKNQAAFVVRVMPLVVVLIGTLAVSEFDLDRSHGVAVVGAVAAGMPAFNFFLPGLGTTRSLIVPAFLMMLIGMVQSITMAQALAIKRRERIDANAELVGLGAANVVAAFSGGMPVGGGLSRSAVNVAAGAQTPLASIVAALAMIGVVAGAAGWFERLPLAVLSASIIMAAISMIDITALRQAWGYDRADALALLGTAGGVLLIGLEAGIGLGIVLSMATLLYRVSTPHIAVVGRIAGSEHFRNVERYAVETIPGVLFIRIDERLFFGNLGAVEMRLKQELEHVPGAHDLVLVMSAVNLMDATAVEVFTELNEDLADQGIRLHLAEVKGPVQDRLLNSALWSALSGEVFLSANAAFEKLAGLPQTGAAPLSQTG